jgi:predicted metalloendopeptidase
MKRIDKNSMTNNAVKKLYETLNDFNFEKVEKVMEFLGWKWQVSANGQVPDKSIIQDEAFKMLVKCYHNYWDNDTTDTCYISCGGLEASYEYFFDSDVEENQKDCFNLKFVLEESI